MEKNHCQHWSQMEWLHKTVKNKNIHISGSHSYYSGFFNGNFEDTVVRYLYGDKFSTDRETGWTPSWEIDKLIIGDYVHIAADVKIIMGGNNNHNTQFITTYPFLELEALRRAYIKKGDTSIGNDVWLGMSCIIMPGVVLGNGVIVAAGTVVTKDVPAYSILAGNPGKVIRKRFSEEDIVILEQLKWWEWSEEKVGALLPILQSGNVKNLLKVATLTSN